MRTMIEYSHDTERYHLFAHRPGEADSVDGWEEIEDGFMSKECAEDAVREISQAADAEAMDAIHEALDGLEWGPNTLDHIAEIVRGTGREIREPDED